MELSNAAKILANLAEKAMSRQFDLKSDRNNQLLEDFKNKMSSKYNSKTFQNSNLFRKAEKNADLFFITPHFSPYGGDFLICEDLKEMYCAFLIGLYCREKKGTQASLLEQYKLGAIDSKHEKMFLDYIHQCTRALSSTQHNLKNEFFFEIEFNHNLTCQIKNKTTKLWEDKNLDISGTVLQRIRHVLSFLSLIPVMHKEGID